MDTNVEEMRAMFGLLYKAGMMRSNHLNLSDLWSNDGFSLDYFRAVMSKTRFYLLLQALICIICIEKKNKNVLMLSTIHNQETIDEESGEKRKS